MDLQRLHRITAMACRMRLKLPSFQVTQRIGTGSTVRRNLPRGRKDDCVEDEQLSSGGEVGSSDLTSSTGFFPTSFDTVTEDIGCSSQPKVSLHAIKQEAATAAWTQVRPALLKAAVECSAMPAAQCCILCLESASYRCIQCAPWAYFCQNCFSEVHSKINFFHTGEVWEVCAIGFHLCTLLFILVLFCQDGVYKPVVVSGRVVDVRLQHECSSSSSIPLTCLDENGRFTVHAIITKWISSCSGHQLFWILKTIVCQPITVF